ncbi:TetR/AcrR family transcriptional regulator [Streptosporangium sp. NPDC049376]|uniref:TetR/AcrR family transcriptional regulator n=1 Tax=Streptosporangium sp. NPDC049376 TaxID=3366192 RepID=UPI0037B2E694
MTSADEQQSEAVIEFATRLFAAFGYDGTTLQGLAEAMGFDLEWLHETFGDKRALYLAVIERTSRAQRTVVEGALASLPARDAAGVAEAMHALVDDYLELCLSNPQIPALWMHRWLGDAADIPDLEQRYAIPIINLTRDALRTAVRDGLIEGDTDLDLLVRTLAWSMYGFLHGEALAPPDPPDPDNPRTKPRLRAHLHQLVDRMLRLPES